MENGSIQVLVVDDEAIVRKGIKSLLKENENISVIGEAASVPKAIELAGRLRPDVVVLDLSMPVMRGIELVKRFISNHPGQRIIVLTDYAGEDSFFWSIQAGAQGYLSKDCHPDELVRSILDVYSGVPAFNPLIAWRSLRKRLISDSEDSGETNGELSERETDVLRLLTKGRTDWEIAEELVLSQVTIRTHISRIIKKLGVRNRVEAALYGIRSGLVSLSETYDFGYS